MEPGGSFDQTTTNDADTLPSNHSSLRRDPLGVDQSIHSTEPEDADESDIQAPSSTYLEASTMPLPPSRTASQNSSQGTPPRSSVTLLSEEHQADHEPNQPHGTENAERFIPVAWRPYVLQPRFFILLSASALTLLFTIALLCGISISRNGLGGDNGSSILLFGWRFVPSLLAVLYVQLTSMLLDGIKNSEPFARLARPEGAPATYSIFQAPGAWWNALADGFSTKKNGSHRSWPLIFSACLNIIGFLAISPLSSSLLLSKDVPITQDVGFSRVTLKDAPSPLQIRNGRDTYLRTIGHILQDVSTSAWISDEYTILPFWPSRLKDAPLGPFLSTSPETWEAETLVLKSDLECSSMALIATGHSASNASIILRANDGCTYGLTLPIDTEFVKRGGSSWSDVSTFIDRDHDQPIPDWTNHSEKCGRRELLFATTSWNSSTLEILRNDSANSFSFSSDFNVSAKICEARYFMADITVRASLSNALSTTSFDENEFREKSVPIPSSLLNINQLHDLTLSPNWTEYMALPDEQHRAAAGGLSCLLAALYDFDMPALLAADVDIQRHASSIKQRFFGEALQFSIIQDGLPSEPLQGQITVIQKRVVVTVGTAIALCALLFASFAISLLLWWLCNTQRRPLNLSSNPATTLGAASLITADSQVRLGLQRYSPSTIQHEKKTLDEMQYSMAGNALRRMTESTGHNPEAAAREEPMMNTNWVPVAIRLRMLVSLILALVVIIAIILVLFVFAQRSLLYRTAFVYQRNVPGLEKTIPAVSLYSFISTLIAVGVGLWWGSIDATFRSLQPYFAMAEKPTRLSNGAALSYQSTYWVWAAWRAATSRHWILCLVALGTSLCPILTIAMSALFQRGRGEILHGETVSQGLELREIPSLFEVDVYVNPRHGDVSTAGVLSNLFTKLSTNWMYSAIIQLALNGSQPAWSLDGWSFVPLDFSSINTEAHVQDLGRGPRQEHVGMEINVSASTQALRGRIKCTPYDELELRNHSNWLETPETWYWDDRDIPKGPDNGTAYQLSVIDFLDTAALSAQGRVECCVNTTNQTGGGVAIGYWSQLNPDSAIEQGTIWPVSFATKWIHGDVSTLNYKAKSSAHNYLNGTSSLIFPKVPSIQALRCKPIIESATAEVTVDAETGAVKSFSMTDEPRELSSSWTFHFTSHETFGGVDPISSSGFDVYDDTYRLNVTASYGVLFLAALLKSTTIRNLKGVTTSWTDGDPGDQTYNIRDPPQGLNMDFMTYSMYSMANKDPQKLLDADLLQNLSQHTFSTFFQHFVSSQVSLDTGGWAYQPINASLPPDLGVPLFDHEDNATAARINTAFESAMHPNSTTPRTAVVRVSTPVELLRVNTVAMALSIGILAWLIATAIVVASVQRRYVKLLTANVECVGDVLLLVCGSEKLLQLVRDRGVGAGRGEDGSQDVMTRLGWFDGGDGELRWGVEVVEEEDEDDDEERDSGNEEGEEANSVRSSI